MRPGRTLAEPRRSARQTGCRCRVCDECGAGRSESAPLVLASWMATDPCKELLGVRISSPQSIDEFPWRAVPIVFLLDPSGSAGTAGSGC
jgi:hypothetical protein